MLLQWQTRKHGRKRRTCWLPAICPFPTVFSKAFFLRVVKKRNCVVKSLNQRSYDPLACMRTRRTNHQENSIYRTLLTNETTGRIPQIMSFVVQTLWSLAQTASRKYYSHVTVVTGHWLLTAEEKSSGKVKYSEVPLNLPLVLKIISVVICKKFIWFYAGNGEIYKDTHFDTDIDWLSLYPCLG